MTIIITAILALLITMAGSELLVEAAAMLGLLPSLPSTFSLPTSTTAFSVPAFTTATSSTASSTFSLLPTITSYTDLVTFGGDKGEDIFREIERLSKDFFEEMETSSSEPLDLLDYLPDQVETIPEDRVTFDKNEVDQDLKTETIEDEAEPSEEPCKDNAALRAGGDVAAAILGCQGISETRRRHLLSLLSCTCGKVFACLVARSSHSCPLSSPKCPLTTCAEVLPSWPHLLQHLTKLHRFSATSLVRKVFGAKSRSNPAQAEAQAPQAQAQAPASVPVSVIASAPAAILPLVPTSAPAQSLVPAPAASTKAPVPRPCQAEVEESVLELHKVGIGRAKCNLCGKEFRNRVSLRTHSKLVHKLGRQYTCSYCGKVLYSSQYLMKHETTHTGERFKAANCRYCGKTVEYCKLKNHELIHTGEKPFKCSDCDYRCIQRSNLRIHMRGVHKKELPRLAVGQKRYSGRFMDGTAGNMDPFDLRSAIYRVDQG